MQATITESCHLQITRTTPLATVSMDSHFDGSETNTNSLRAALIADLTIAGLNALEIQDAVNLAGETLGFSLWS